MGIGFDTSCTFDFVLEIDRDKPEAERPSLTYRFVSLREMREMEKVLADPQASLDFDKVLVELKKPLVGWKNQPIAFDPNQLDSLLSPIEICELRDGLLNQMVMSEIDKKKSKRQSS